VAGPERQCRRPAETRAASVSPPRLHEAHARWAAAPSAAAGARAAKGSVGAGGLPRAPGARSPPVEATACSSSSRSRTRASHAGCA
jgi:hypothetical protein